MSHTNHLRDKTFYYASKYSQTDNLNVLGFDELQMGILNGCFQNNSICSLIKEIRGLFNGYEKYADVPSEINIKANNLKKQLPVITVSITGNLGGSKMKDYNFTGFAQYDIDWKENDELSDINYRKLVKEKLISLPNVMLVATSPRNGIKIIAHIGIASNNDDYKRRWKGFRIFLGKEIGLNIDNATSAVNQYMFLTHDDEALVDDEKPIDNIDELISSCLEQEGACKELLPQVQKNVPENADIKLTIAKAKFYVDQILEKRLDITDGYSNWKKIAFSFASIGEAGRDFFVQVSSIYKDFNITKCNNEFTKTLKYYDPNRANARTIASFFFDCDVTYNLVKFNQSDTVIQDAKNDNNMVVLEEDTEQINTSPLLVHDVENVLPEILQKVTALANTPREKDIALMSFIVAFSGLFSNIKVGHRKEWQNINLFQLIIAPPASGKGTIDLAKKLFSKVYEVIHKENQEEINAWKALDEEDQKSIPKPLERKLFLPSDTSTAALYDLLIASKGTGIMIATEISRLAGSLKTTWGHFIALLCETFHNESSENSRKGRYQELKDNCFSTILGGTIATVYKCIDNKNGLYSRFLIYFFREITDLDKDVFKSPEDGEIDTAIPNLQDEVLNIFLRIREMQEISFSWHEKHAEELYSYFDATHRAAPSYYGDDISSYIKRATLMASRIGAILTLLRSFDTQEEITEDRKSISDEDYFITRIIMDRLQKHAFAYFENMDKESKTIGNSATQKFMILTGLPDEFTMQSHGNDMATSLAVSPKTIKRRLEELVQEGFLKHKSESNRIYLKTNKCLTTHSKNDKETNGQKETCG